MTTETLADGVLVGTLLGRPTSMPAGAGAKAPWSSSIIRSAVSELILETDGPRENSQVDCVNHGGADKAVLAYAAAHYAAWRRELGREDMGPGGWGENLLIDGHDESSVCIGDRYAIGDVLVEVSQPRQPCWKLGARWAMPELTKLTLTTSRTGWYLRVLVPGTVRAGDRVSVRERPHADWTIARATRVYHDARADHDDLAALSLLPELAEAWRKDLLRRL